MARVIFNGEPGTVFTNDTGKVLFQLIVAFHNSCGTCIQFARAIGPSWPTPFHRGCLCVQIPVLPGKDALPFVDFMAEIRALPAAQRAVAVGRANWQLVNKGVVDFSEVVTPQRVRTLREVVSRNRLDVGTLFKAGVNRRTAEQAYQAVHTPAHEFAAAHRKTLVDALAAKGLTTEQVKTAFGQRVVGRVGIAGGPGARPVRDAPAEPAGASAPGRADVTAAVLGSLGVTPAPAAPPPAPPPPRRFDSPGAMDRWGESAYRDWAAGLSPAEGAALREYTASAFDRFNKALRAGKSDQWLGPTDRSDVADLTAALSRARLPEPITVYRGVRKLDKLGLKAADLVPGLVLPADRGFGSTSLDADRAAVFAGGGLRGGVLFRIDLPAGAPGAYVNAAGEFSAKKGEKEFLIPPGALKLRVKSVARLPTGRHVIHAELVP